MRSQANTSITFGLVNVPVGVCKATEDRRVKLNMASPDGLRVTQQYTDENGWTGAQDECQRGVFTPEGEFRPVDFSEVDPELPESLEVLDTIALKDVPFDRVTGLYYLQNPSKGGYPKGYKLIMEALKKSKRAIVSQWAARSVVQPVVVYEQGGCLVMNTLTYAKDVREADEQVLSAKHTEVSKAEVEVAVRLLDQMTTESALDTLDNPAIAEQQELVEAALQAKPRKGRKTAPKKAEAPACDLMGLLAASLDGAKAAA